MGATHVVDPRGPDAARTSRPTLGMVEGFDVVLEMSGNAGALRDALGNMAHGGGMAILGIPTEEIPIDVSQVVFNQLTLRGIYGREMYETWYKMSVMLQSGLDIRPAITHRFSYRDHEAAFAAARSGDSGKVMMELDRLRHPMTDEHAAPIPWPSSARSSTTSATGTCTGRCGSCRRPRGRSSRSTSARLISLSSNDYLGLTHHPRLEEAALGAVRDFGAGSGAVRTIAGTMTLHEELERDLAAFKGTAATLTFQSGFTRQHRASSRRSPASRT